MCGDIRLEKVAACVEDDVMCSTDLAKNLNF